MCKQDKSDTIVNWTEEKFTHIDELRNKGYLRNTRNYPNMDPIRKTKKTTKRDSDN